MLATVVHVVGRHVANGFVEPRVVVVLHEASDGALQLPGAVVIFEAHHILRSPEPSLRSSAQ